MKRSFKFVGTLVAAVGAVAGFDMASAYADQPCPMPVVNSCAVNSFDDRIQRLEDTRQIEELKAQYGNALDNVVKDPSTADTLINLFTDDICLDYGPFGRFRGKTVIKSLFQQTVPTITAWDFHIASSPLLQINGAVATGTWRVIAESVSKPDYPPVSPAFARYQDAYSKTSAGWKFKTIIVVFDTPPTGANQ
jgi:hypothetical protein